MSVLTDIQQAFFRRISSSTIDADMVYPNRNADTTRPQLRVNILPAQTVPVGLRTSDLYTGMCQIDVVVEANVGAIKATDIVGEILDLFPRNLFLTENDTLVKINKTASTNPAVQDGTGYFIPVSIPYEVIK